MKTMLILALAVLLAGCKPAMPATVKADAPIVDCVQPLNAQIPDWPVAGQWQTEGKAYAVTLLGIVTDDRIAHGKEGECLAKLRKAGLIR